MAAIDSNNNPPPLEITKMVYSEQAKAAAVILNFCAITQLSFYTPHARRKFEKNFYYLSLKLVGLAKGLSPKVLDAHDVFLSSLDKLKQELTLTGYPQWLDIAHTLQEEVLVVIVLTARCTRLLRTLLAMDKFLLPVYAAYIGQRISKEEFDTIKNQMTVLFDDLKHSLKELPSHANVGKRRSRFIL